MKKDQLNPFLLSALTEDNQFISTQEVENWLQQRNDEVHVDIEQIPFSAMENWGFDDDKARLSHTSGQFFSIDGVRIRTSMGFKSEWDQPIINQPEIGYLGIITKEFDGVLYFLLQAKIEPGNINNVQLSPTLQATKSNYTQVHGGKVPAYLEYFKDRKNVTVHIDQLQSEQGARFLQKRNRNMIIQVYDEIEIQKDFVWLTLGQIKRLINKDNLINMDTRTVISGIPFKIFDDISLFSLNEGEHTTQLLISSLNRNISLYSFDDLIAWLTELKCNYEVSLKKIALSQVKDWLITDSEIVHKDERFFKVIAARIVISNREVSSWCQPLIKPTQEGIAGFIIKQIHGVLHFLVQAKFECGNFDILELAPTVQTLTGDYRRPDYEIPFLEYILHASKEQIWYDAMQSEEGGRFYHEQNRNMIVEADANFPIDLPPNYKWMTLHQLTTFLKFNNYLNIQARSIMAAINFI